MQRTALVVGATGIGGGYVARQLVANGWAVHRLARRPIGDPGVVTPVAADLLDPKSLLDALAPKKTVRHVALATGLKHYLGPFEAYAQSGTLPDRHGRRHPGDRRARPWRRISVRAHARRPAFATPLRCMRRSTRSSVPLNERS